MSASRGGNLPAHEMTAHAGVVHGLPREPLSEDEVRSLLRECVTVVKPGETLIIRGDPDWTPLQLREVQEWLDREPEWRGLDFRILVVPGAELGVAEAQESAAPRIRAAVFCGGLSWGDYTITRDGGQELVAIDRRARAIESPGDLGTAMREGARAAEDLAARGGPASRSPRPFKTVTASWGADDAGLGIFDLGRRFTEANASSLAEDLPGESLEAWLLPVTDFSFSYLITPAGDWPPEPAGA